jgi:hypothetical protein
MGMRQKVTKLLPRDAAAQLALARDAYATQSYATVATALQSYLQLSPTLTKAQKTQLRQQIAQFKVLAKQSSSAGSSGTTSPSG